MGSGLRFKAMSEGTLQCAVNKWPSLAKGSLEPGSYGRQSKQPAPDEPDRSRRPKRFLEGESGNEKPILEDLAVLNSGLAIPPLPAAGDALDCRILAALGTLCRGQDTLYAYLFADGG